MSLIGPIWPGTTASGFNRIEPSFGERSVYSPGATTGTGSFDAFLNDVTGASVSGVRVSERTALQISAVFACCSYIAQDIAKLGISIYRGARKGARQPATKHALFTLLARPAPWITWFEFCGMLQMSVLLRGNGYAVIVRDSRGNPQRLFPVHPDFVTLCEATDGSLFYRVRRHGAYAKAALETLPLMIPAEDILHLKPLSSDGLLGMSPLALERETFGLALAQQQLAARWTGNGAQPRGILTADKPLTPDIRNRTSEAWAALQGGLLNAGKTAVFESGIKWQPLSMTAQDMEFLASRGYSDMEIYRIFRVPLYMGGEKGASKASVSQNATEYLNLTLSTHIEMWEQRIALTFDLQPDEFVEFDEDRLLRADIQTRYAANRLSLGGQAWDTVNAVRADEGKAPIEGGDVLFRPVNMAPIDSNEFEANDNPPDAGTSGAGSDQTGQGAEGGGRPNEDGTPAKPQGVKK